MRRIVVMSDIHGNLTALQAVAESLPQADEVVVAGDHCMDGADPAGVIDLIRERGWHAIVGNTDRDICEYPADLKPKAADSVSWTRQQLGDERLRFLAEMPFAREISTGGERPLLVVHANPVDLDGQLRMEMTETELAPYLEGVNAEVVAFGHLHIPYTRPVAGLLLVDVSSVGHPKDGDRRAAYSVLEWDGTRRSVTQVRIPYDVDRAVDRMRRSDMPAARRIASLLKASY